MRFHLNPDKRRGESIKTAGLVNRHFGDFSRLGRGLGPAAQLDCVLGRFPVKSALFSGKTPTIAMETTYAMIGSDGQQYGPVTLAQIKTWILEGRIGAETKVWRSDTNSWLAAAQYVELGLGHAAAPPVPPGGMPVPGVIRAPTASTYDPMLERRARSGARWFYWIAGLSLVNTFTLSHGGAFLVGLAVTPVIQGFAAGLGQQYEGVGTGLSVAVSALFAIFGYFAWKGQSWSFIVGMVLYGLDAALLLGLAALTNSMRNVGLMVAFHVLVLVWIFRGWQASIKLKSASPGGPG
jgi:GYF domain 2